MNRTFKFCIGFLALSSLAAQASESIFVSSLTCQVKLAEGQTDPGLGTMTIFTRIDVASLDALSEDSENPTSLPVATEGQFNLKKGEFNNWGGYNGISATRKEYKYSQTSCDTEDDVFTFNTEDLLLENVSKSGGNVSGKLDSSTRGEGDVYNIQCEAL